MGESKSQEAVGPGCQGTWIAAWKGEVLGGVTQFFSSVYCLSLVPLAFLDLGWPGGFSRFYFSTVLLMVGGAFLMAVMGRSPWLVAPGVGIHAFFVQHVLLAKQLGPEVGFALIFWSGVVMALIYASPWAYWLYESIPSSLRAAMSLGMGFFLIRIAIENGPWQVWSEAILMALQLGCTLFLLKKKSPFAFLIGMGASFFLGWAVGWVVLPQQWVSLPEGLFQSWPSLAFREGLHWRYWPIIFSLSLTSFLDVTATLLMLGTLTGRLDSKGNPLRFQGSALAVSFANMWSGWVGASPATVYLEGLPGVQVGARSGWAAVVLGSCFLGCLFLAPLVEALPLWMATPLLMLVGGLLIQGSWEEVKRHPLWFERFPLWITAASIPLFFSLIKGLTIGLWLQIGCWMMASDRKKITPGLIVLGLLALCSWVWDNSL